MSKKTTKYKQVTVEQTYEGGKRIQVSWIPEKFAKVGKVLSLEDSQGVWSDNWKVTQVNQQVIRTHEQVIERSRSHLRHRSHSDI